MRDRCVWSNPRYPGTACPCVRKVMEYIYLNLYAYEYIFTKIQFEVVAGSDDLVLVRRLAGAGLDVGGTD